MLAALRIFCDMRDDIEAVRVRQRAIFHCSDACVIEKSVNFFAERERAGPRRSIHDPANVRDMRACAPGMSFAPKLRTDVTR